VADGGGSAGGGGRDGMASADKKKCNAASVLIKRMARLRIRIGGGSGSSEVAAAAVAAAAMVTVRTSLVSNSATYLEAQDDYTIY
jgi:hypothetical protein